MFRLFKPEVFQGNLFKKEYFEGWYFKHVSADGNQVYAFIPGISISKEDPHAFIQVINGISGETHYISYPVDQFNWKRDRLYVKVGGSVFTSGYIDLDIDDAGISVKGRLDYQDLSPFPRNLLSPGIMGYYAYLPHMECYHGVVSANHFIKGSLDVHGKNISFEQGKGYVEKDWGRSFPESWIWVQSNSFPEKDASVFVSVAKIPWFGRFFMGFIAFLYWQGKYYKFATYNRSRVDKVAYDKQRLAIVLSNRKYKLEVDCKQNQSGDLQAPVRGNMNRRIKESIDSEVDVSLQGASGKVLFQSHSNHAGLEIIESVFEYL